jgi:hypothetical protein
MSFAISSASSAIYAYSPYANALRASGTQQGGAAQTAEEKAAGFPDNKKADQPDQLNQIGKSGTDNTGRELSQADQRRVEQLKATDRAVRAHEAAHVAAGGGLTTGGISFGYETGPDGQRYAVSGEVGISMSRGRTPEETLARAQQIRAAALAPADPSGPDRAVAAAAAQMATEARAEIAEANIEENSDAEPSDILPAALSGSEPDNPANSPSAIAPGSSASSDAANALGQMIARSLTPPPMGRAVNTYA